MMIDRSAPDKKKERLLLAVFYALTLFVLTGVALAYGDTADNEASFSGNSGVLTTAVLNTVIAGAQVNAVIPVSAAVSEGNRIGGGAFQNAFGLIVVNQNSGSNANMQESISFKIGDLAFSPAH